MGKGYELRCIRFGHEESLSVGYGRLYPMMNKELRDKGVNGEFGEKLSEKDILAGLPCPICDGALSIKDYFMWD